MVISLNSKRIIPVLLGTALLLTLINIVVLYFGFHSERRMVEMLANIYDFDYEGTVPAFFSAVVLLFNAIVLAINYRKSRFNSDGNSFYWGSLSLIFGFLAIDEASRIHENFSDVFELFMDSGGLLYFLWVIPYGIATFLLGLFYLRFLWRLPSATRRRFIVAGIIFLTGAIAFDMLGGLEAETYGFNNVIYCALYTIEEFLEMLGSILFLSALLRHLGPISLTLGEPSPPPPED